MSSSFDATEDIHHTPGADSRCGWHDRPNHPLPLREKNRSNSHEDDQPYTPSTPDISYSQVSTPKMSQRDAGGLDLVLDTPPHHRDLEFSMGGSNDNTHDNNENVDDYDNIEDDLVGNRFVDTPPRQSFAGGYGEKNENGGEIDVRGGGATTPTALPKSIMTSSSLFITPFPDNDGSNSPNDNNKNNNKIPFYDPLEPPAWKPADPDEIEFVESFHTSYNNQYHYLQAGIGNFPKGSGGDDSSTICSSQTNNSLTNNYHVSGGGLGGINSNHGHGVTNNNNSNNHIIINSSRVLRPRGLSISSHRSSDNASITSGGPQPHIHCPPQHRRHPSLPQSLFSSRQHLPQQNQQGHSHRRHPSLPQSIFSSHSSQVPPLHPFQNQASQLYQQSMGQQGQGQNHPLQGDQSQSQQHQQQQQQQQQQPHYNKRPMTLLQSTKQTTPYEIHSHHNVSQVKADAAIAGLSGTLLDLYVVDRCVDGATARMLAMKEEEEEEYDEPPSHHPLLTNPSSLSGPDTKFSKHEKFHRRNSSGTSQQQQQKQHRKTSMGTLNDIQTILELHRVDKMVDRFKLGLQMPVFIEEEAWDSSVFRELRKVDLEIDECRRLKKEKHTVEDGGKASLVETVNVKSSGKEYSKRVPVKDHTQMRRYENREQDDWYLDEESEDDMEDFYCSTDSYANVNAYDFYDPLETNTLLQSHTYQSSVVSASVNDNLNEIIDLLRTDVEIDGATRRNSEMDMVRPLYEMDKNMEKWRGRAQFKDMWDQGDVRALYLVDLEVDRARMRGGRGSRAKKTSGKSDLPPPTDEQRSVESSDGLDSPIVPVSESQEPVPRPNDDSSSNQTDDVDHANMESEEMKNILARHIPNVSQPLCPTSPAMAPIQQLQAKQFVSPNSQPVHPQLMPPLLELSPLQPPPPLVPPEPSKRSIFTNQEKAHAKMLGSDHNTTSHHCEVRLAKANTFPQPPQQPAKRSIFSLKEKSTAAKQCAFQRGVMTPGTTTVVRTDGGDMIDDIPVGKVVVTALASGERKQI